MRGGPRARVSGCNHAHTWRTHAAIMAAILGCWPPPLLQLAASTRKPSRRSLAVNPCKQQKYSEYKADPLMLLICLLHPQFLILHPSFSRPSMAHALRVGRIVSKETFDSGKPLIVSCAGNSYDLSSFRHPGGSELLERHNNTDITHLFYSNHFQPDIALLDKHWIGGANTGKVADIIEFAHSPSYARLQQEVHAHLTDKGIEWRHQFSYAPYVLRLAALLTCFASHNLIAPGRPLQVIIAFASAAIYGFLTGRQTWTHAHNGVHNPSKIPRAMRWLLHFDFVGVLDVWMAEHHSHHAHTNRHDDDGGGGEMAHGDLSAISPAGAGDPDLCWWCPLFSYTDVAAGAVHPIRARVLAGLAYPFLVPVMLVKSLKHAILHDPKGVQTAAWVACVAPLRFTLDIGLLGLGPFALALACATLYILATFVATHQVASNHAFEPSDCWMARQIRATNNVWPRSKVYSFLCGGINNHIEHHCFPQVSSAVLPELAPIVEAFAQREGLPYRAFSPLRLAREHMGFLGGSSRPAGRG